MKKVATCKSKYMIFYIFIAEFTEFSAPRSPNGATINVAQGCHAGQDRGSARAARHHLRRDHPQVREGAAPSLGQDGRLVGRQRQEPGAAAPAHQALGHGHDHAGRHRGRAEDVRHDRQPAAEELHSRSGSAPDSQRLLTNL